MSDVKEGWELLREWRQIHRQNKFSVSIAHHEKQMAEPGERHGWCVYAYIWSDHPLFNEIASESDYWTGTLNDMPLHCGCTFIKFHRKGHGDDSIGCKQVGCDYSHLGDEIFTGWAPEGDQPPIIIQDDAERLVEYLTAKAALAKARGEA